MPFGYEYDEKYFIFLKSLNKDDEYLVGLSLTYFNIYLEKFDEAKKIIDKLLIKYPKSNEMQNAYIVLNLINIHDKEKIDEKAEDEIFKQIKLMKQVDENGYPTPIYRFTLYLLLDMYKNRNLYVDAVLVHSLINSYLGHIDLKTFREVEEFLNNPQTSKLKQYIQNSLNEKLKKEKFFSKNYNNTKFDLLLANFKFKEALDTNISYLNEKLEFNPFNAQIRGNNRSGKNNQITIKEFLEKIITVENVLEQDPKSTMDNFLYATAIYNLSYFGNNAKLISYYGSDGLYTAAGQDIQLNNLNMALSYYENALKNTNNKELKAKIVYQIAKVKLCLADISYYKGEWHSAYYLYPEPNQKYFYTEDKFYEFFLENGGASSFDSLVNEYSNTKYYQELIKSCGDFKTYIKLNHPNKIKK